MQITVLIGQPEKVFSQEARTVDWIQLNRLQLTMTARSEMKFLGARRLRVCNENISYALVANEDLTWSKQGNSALLLKIILMSRIRQKQNIDSLIHSIETITENRCSLSDEDIKLLLEAQNLLENLKRKKGKTNDEILSIASHVVVLISSIFQNDFKGDK